MTLISRQINIATSLLNNPQVHKVKDLSNRYKVSVRTLRNDLKRIADWVNKQPGCQYHAKPGKGVWISFASDFNRKKAIDDLQSFENEESIVSHYLNPTQRKWRLLTELVFSDNYLTGKELTKMLGVSTNTFLADLANAEVETKKFNLKLISKNYYGYSLEGSEIHLRALMEYVLQKQLDKYSYGATSLIDMIAKITTRSVFKSYLPKEVSKLINYVSLILADKLDLSESLNSGLDLSVAKSMINRLAIIIFENKRQRGLNAGIVERKLNKTQKIYVQIYQAVIKTFHLKPSLEEEKYFVFGVNVLEKTVKTDEVVKKVIAYVSKALDLPLINDIKLRDSLTQHLMSELNSNYQHFTDYTPFTEEVKNRFNVLFLTVGQALEKYISKSPIIISDTFITLVSLHFLVAISDIRKNPQVRILYVCSSGLCATKLLEKVIQGSIPDIVSVGFASVINYRIKIRELKPDLVISIFPLEKVSNIPITQVNPIPNEKDLRTIQKKVSCLTTTSLSLGVTSVGRTVKNERYINNVEKVLSLSIEAFIKVSDYLDNQISKKYKKAFMIHVQLATERIYFNKQYNIKPTNRQIRKFSNIDIENLRKIFSEIKLEINISEIVAMLRYTLMK